MADETIKKFKIETDNRALEDTRKEIERIKSEMLQTKDVDTFNKLALEAGNLETEVKRVEDAVTSLSGSGSELTKMSTSFGRLGASVASLDFGAAAEEAGRLASISKTMSFKSAVSSLKDLGKTFAGIGKALLTNPLFLLAGVVTAIIVGIGKLMDELGILETIFEAIGDAVGWVIEKLKEFLDWLGLTDYAGEEWLQSQIDRSNEAMESHKEMMTSLTAMADHELALMRARGEDTTRAEAAKLKVLEKSAAAQVQLAKETAEHILKLRGEDSEEYQEQLKAIKQLEQEALQATRNVELFEVQTEERLKSEREKAAKESAAAAKRAAEERKRVQQEIAKAQLDADRMIREAQIEMIDDEITRAETMAAFKENQAFAEIDRKHLTDQQIEDLEFQHQMRLEMIRSDAEQKRKEREEAAKQKELDDQKALQDQIAELYNQQLQETAERIAEEQAMRVAAKEGAIELSNQVLGAISANLKEGSRAAKAMAVAQATIDTYKSANAAFAATAANPISIAFPAAPYLAAAAAVAMGIANVRNILRTDNSGSSTSSVSSGGGSSFQAPSLGSRQDVPNTPTLNINNGVEANTGGTAERQKAIVVDYYDISEKGSQLQGLKNRAKLAVE